MPGSISEHRIDIVISGGMGPGAIEFFKWVGAKAASGASGTVEQTLKQFLAGELPIMQPCDDGAELEKHRHHDH